MKERVKKRLSEQLPLEYLGADNPRAHDIGIEIDNEDNDLDVGIPPTSRSEAGCGYENDDDIWTRALPSRNPQMGDTEDGVRRRGLRREKSFKHGTMRLPQGVTLGVSEMVEGLLSDEDFVDGSPEQQADAVRRINTTLSQKMKIKAEVTRTERDKRLNWCTEMGYSTAMAWTHLKMRLADAAYSLKPWRDHINVVAGHFGTGVMSYFTFLRSLFFLNIITFILPLSFVVIPQVLYRYLQQEPLGYTQNVSFTGRELLTGGGWFLQTELHYSYYFSGVITVKSALAYDMRFAYLFTCGGYYLLTGIMLTVHLSKLYRRNYVEGSGGDGTSLRYVQRVFCGWDYTISQAQASRVKHNSIFKDLQEYLSQFRADDEQTTCCQSCGLLVLRMMINLLVLGLLAGAGFLVWYMSNELSLSVDNLLKDLAVPLCISAINYIVPFAFSFLANFETYKNPRVEVYLTMVRVMALNAVTLGVLLYFWYNNVNCASRNPSDMMSYSFECRPCWESFMGEQLYRLVIIDFIFLLLITFFSEFVRGLMSRFCCKSLGRPEFNVGRNALNLIYSQMLVWLGTFYSPLLSFIMILKIFFIFYVKQLSVLKNCVPPSKPWRAGQSSTVLVALLFLVYLGSFCAAAYGVFFLKPSEVCGPYQGYNTSYQMLTDLWEDWEASKSGDSLRGIISVITSVAFLGFVITVLAVAAYYTKVVSKAYGDMTQRLRIQITLEGRDKKFLLQLLQQASRMGRERHRPSVTLGSGHGGGAAAGAGFRKRNLSRDAGSRDDPRSPTSPDGPGSLGSSGSSFHSGPESPVSPQPGPSESYNQGFVDRSLEHPFDGTPDDATNLAYRDHSLHSRPNLPYPGRQYERPQLD